MSSPTFVQHVPTLGTFHLSERPSGSMFMSLLSPQLAQAPGAHSPCPTCLPPHPHPHPPAPHSCAAKTLSPGALSNLCSLTDPWLAVVGGRCAGPFTSHDLPNSLTVKLQNHMMPVELKLLARGICLHCSLPHLEPPEKYL